MKYELTELDEFRIAGITSRVKNDPEGFAKIGALWQQFHGDQIHASVKPDTEEVVEAYMDYANDETGEYTLLLGAKCSASADLPQNVEVKEIPAGRYAVFTLEDASKIKEGWEHIWKRDDLNRRFGVDFEIIEGNKAKIFVGIE